MLIKDEIGNPELFKDKIQDMFIKLGLNKEEIFGGYVPSENLKYQKKYLKKYIKFVKLYYSKILKRPLSENDYIIISNGSLGAFYAIVYAIKDLLNKNYNDKLKIYQINKPPTYTIYKDVGNIIADCEFSYNKSNEDNNIDCDIGLIISPNNPTGEIINERKGKFQIIDEVYNIPIFTNTYKSVNTKYSENEIYLDSFSKMGFPSYRFGWAITSNLKIAKKAWEYMNLYNIGLTTPSFFLSQNIINLFIKYNNYYDYYTYCYNQIIKRKKKLILLFKKYKLFDEKYCLDYTPYLFLPISQEKFKKIGILSRKGSEFFFSDSYSRLNLMIYTSKFEHLYKILKENEKFLTSK